MNPSVQDHLDKAFIGFLWLLVIGAAIYFVRFVLTLALKRRVKSGLLPGMADDDGQTFFPRLLALIGGGAAPQQTLNVVKLKSTLGLRLVIWGGFVGMIVLHQMMSAPPMGLETLLAVLVLVSALQITLYEISYDRTEVSLPRWWFGRTTHRWRSLVAITDRDPWMMTFHFADGQKVKIYKHIVGRADFMKTAENAIRDI